MYVSYCEWKTKLIEEQSVGAAWQRFTNANNVSVNATLPHFIEKSFKYFSSIPH